jgi:hypothetical protein
MNIKIMNWFRKIKASSGYYGWLDLSGNYIPSEDHHKTAKQEGFMGLDDAMNSGWVRVFSSDGSLGFSIGDVNNRQISQMVNIIRESDSSDYYFSKGERYEEATNWLDAVRALRKLL